VLSIEKGIARKRDARYHKLFVRNVEMWKFRERNVEDIRTIRRKDVRSFMEGEEQCRLYYKTEELLFGTSSLLPGKKGAVDPGHKKGHEIFYVASGRVVCHIPRVDRHEELEEGDVVVIPPGEPHELINQGTKEALVCWSLAPPD
jgi:mannose-6-phosphate isomerase-like protein (cupin superfamily)